MTAPVAIAVFSAFVVGVLLAAAGATVFIWLPLAVVMLAAPWALGAIGGTIDRGARKRPGDRGATSGDGASYDPVAAPEQRRP